MCSFPPLISGIAGLLLLAISSCVCSEPEPESEDFLVEIWNTDSGLPHSTVTSIAQTPDGYLWAGTLRGGLARFDGVRFQTFSPGNTPEMKSYNVQKLLVDPAGTLWIGMADGSLISYKNGHFHFERQSEQMPQDWLAGLVSSRDNNVVFSSVNGGLFYGMDGNTSLQWSSTQPPDANHASSPCADKDGAIWYRTAGGLLACISPNGPSCFANPPGLESPIINTLLTDDGGRLWVGTDKELALWDGRTFVNMTPPNGEQDLGVRQIAAAHDGTLWIRTDHDLRKWRNKEWIASADHWDQRFQPTARSLSMFGDSHGGLWLVRYGSNLCHVDANGGVSDVKEKHGLPASKLVECWFEDREGNVWIGLTGGGLACVRTRTFHTVWPGDGLSYKMPCSICEDGNGAMWFGTLNGGLLRWKDSNFTAFTLPVEQKAALATTVFPDSGDRLWVGSVQNGAVVLNNGEFSRPFHSDAIGTTVRALYIDRKGRIWMGNEFGLFCWESGELKVFKPSDGFTPAYVSAITEDTAGNIWIGTAIGELRRYRNGQFATFKPADTPSDGKLFVAAGTTSPLQSRSIGEQAGNEYFFRTLYADGEGIVWIGTLGGGLLRFQDGNFTRFTPRDGLPNEYVSQILEDRRGRLWLGTRNGITRVDKQALNKSAGGEAGQVPFTTYGKFDGLPAVECSSTSQPACWRGRDGRLWFSTIKGAVWTDPADLPFNPLPPTVMIEEVSVDGQPVPTDPSSRLQVPPGRHYLNFKFAAPSLTSPDKVRFKWRLEGVEKNWNPASSQRSAGYGFVPPGDYEFQVQACNNDGVWNTTGAALEFTVRTHFWQTWWFKLCAVFAGVALLAILYSARITRLRSLERLRLRIARDLHDEVGSNLGAISLLAQVMEKRPLDSKAAQMHSLAVETIDTLRDIVWFINPKHERLSDLVERLHETAGNMLQNIPHEFTQHGDFGTAKLPLAFRHNVPPIFKESLHNIIRHSNATQVKIEVERRGGVFQFRITDNGRGFGEPANHSGNGLKNMRRRAADIGGRLDIVSRTGQGTTVTLSASITQTRNWRLRLKQVN